MSRKYGASILVISLRTTPQKFNFQIEVEHFVLVCAPVETTRCVLNKKKLVVSTVSSLERSTTSGSAKRVSPPLSGWKKLTPIKLEKQLV